MNLNFFKRQLTKLKTRKKRAQSQNPKDEQAPKIIRHTPRELVNSLVSPLSPIGLPGRTDEEVAADGQRLVWIEDNILPSQLIREAVAKFLRNIANSSLQGALGSPALVSELLEEVAGSDRLQRLRSQLEEHYAQVAEQFHQEPSSQGMLEEEYQTAQKDLVRHWVDLVGSAVMLWGEFDSIQFDDNACPIPPKDQEDQWREFYTDSLDSLLVAIAIDHADMPLISSAFASALREHTQDGKTIELPDRIDVRCESGKLVAGRRTFAR